MNQLAPRLAVIAVLLTLTAGNWDSYCTCFAGCKRNYCANAGGTQDALLPRGQSLYSRNRKARLDMQTDETLVLYCTDGNRVIWTSGNYRAYTRTSGVVFQKDGNLVIYGSDWQRGQVKFETNTHEMGGAVLLLQNDANLVIYTNYGKVVWATHTNGRC